MRIAILILIDNVSLMRVMPDFTRMDGAEIEDWLRKEFGMAERMLDRFAECNECMRGETVKVKVSEMSAYMGGVLLQDAFPDLSDAERNVVNGSVNPYFLCNMCWQQLMVDEDEC